jgi:hypothetical protein
MRKPITIKCAKLCAGTWLVPRKAIAHFLAAVFCVLALQSRAQSPPVVWSKQIAGPFQTSQNAGVALDQQDNFYYAANFVPRTFTIGNQTLTNRSAYAGYWAENGFIAKFSRAGDFLWVRQIGGTWSDGPTACATDADGSVLVTGAFASSNVVFGGTVLTNSAQDVASCFLVKYDSQGDVLWARQSSYGPAQETGGTTVIGLSVAADAVGNVWLAGYFDSSNVIFGTNVLINTGYGGSTPVTQDFLLKYDSAGNVLWAQTVAVNDNLFNTPSIGLDTNGNALYSDYFSGVALVGTTTVTNVSGNASGVLLAKFDAGGNVLWAEQAAYCGNGGGISSDALAVDSQGNCRIAGTYWNGAAVFASNSLPVPVSDGYGGFVANFGGSGAFLWANTSADQYGVNVSIDAIGNCYLAGFAAISKYATNGTLLWTTNSLGFFGPEVGAVDPAGTLFVVGATDGLADGFSAAKLSGPTLNIQPSGNQVVVSWPTNEVGLSLGSAPGLFGPWSPVTNPSPAIIGNQYFVTNTVSPGRQYFRLGNF